MKSSLENKLDVRFLPFITGIFMRDPTLSQQASVYDLTYGVLKHFPTLETEYQRDLGSFCLVETKHQGLMGGFYFIETELKA